jgi:hypothetical protein
MIYFLDFEASSLADGSFPIEVAWVDRNGQGEHYLIRPAAAWLDAAGNPLAWGADSERIHGISFAALLVEGVAHDRVAKRVAHVLGSGDAQVYSDGSESDGYWMRRLLGAADIRFPVPVLDVQTLYASACRPLLTLLPPEGVDGRWRAEQRIGNLAREVVAAAEEAEHVRSRVQHRALPDAESLWRTWRAIRDQVARRIVTEIKQ